VRHGRLTIIGPAPPRGGMKRSRVLCDCGRSKIIFIGNLRRGSTRSCGCLAIEVSRVALHGHCRRRKRTPTWIAWSNMRATAKRRGVDVDTRWRDFAAFLEDVGLRPGGFDTVLRRVDVERGFERANVEWRPKRRRRRRFIRQ